MSLPPSPAGRPASPASPLRVVIVNDSATTRAALRAAVASEPDLEVVGEAADGARAVSVVTTTRPAIVLMDVVMPRLDGYAATREIMAVAPTPILLVSSAVNPRDVGVALEALRSGALAVVDALPAPTDPAYVFRRNALLHMIRSMAAVRVGARAAAEPLAAPLRRAAALAASEPAAAIGIATSTGGPGALAEVLRALPPGEFPPLLVVQHIARGFAEGFARWLGQASGQPALIAEHHVPLARGTVYIAPDDRHLGLDAQLRAVLSDDPPTGLFRPSGTYLFRSMARALGPRAAGVVLTGMGDDAADGALAIRNAGGRVAVQDEPSSVVYGMPRAALERGGGGDVLPLGEVPGWILARGAR